MRTERPRAVLRARLEARRSEIEEAVLTRVRSISDPSEVADSTYVEGLNAAVTIAIDHSFGAVDRTDNRLPSVPPGLLTQARVAARNGVSLDTVLRRYFAGYSLLNELLIEEAGEVSVDRAELKVFLRAQTALFDRLVMAVSEEYQREADVGLDSAERRRAEQVERLLAGEATDASELAYRMEGHHLGMIALGRRAAKVIRELSTAIDCQVLLVQHGEETVWAWLGAAHEFDASKLEAVLSGWPAGLHLAIGEPSQGLDGWRLTHQQARAALPVALRGSQTVVCYRDVALLASMLGDAVLAASLHDLYLRPLALARDGGAVLRQTLRAYFAAERNTSSTAAALGVSRQTVINRLRSVEERISRPLGSCSMELEAALRLNDLGASTNL